MCLHKPKTNIMYKMLLFLLSFATPKIPVNCLLIPCFLCYRLINRENKQTFLTIRCRRQSQFLCPHALHAGYYQSVKCPQSVLYVPQSAHYHPLPLDYIKDAHG